MLKKGKILVRTVDKGKKVECKIEFENKKGKIVSFVVTEYEFELALNGKECEIDVSEEISPPIFNKIIIDGAERHKRAAKAEVSRHHEGRAAPHGDKVKKELNDSFCLQKTKLPDYFKNSGLNDIDNFHLKFYRAARFEEEGEKSKFLFFKRNERKNNLDIPGFMIKTNNFPGVNFKYLCKNLEEGARNLFSSPSSVLRYEFEPDWRLVVGLGGDSAYEVSMTLHHVYGFPYIPASAVKGVSRCWVITSKFGTNEHGETDLKRAEMRALQDKTFCDIFGCPEEDSYTEEDGRKIKFKSAYKEARKGKITFFDAYPLNAPKIKADIMNPHYSEYYSSGKPPVDYMKLIPIPFLMVEKTHFQFLIAAKEDLQIKSESKIFPGMNLLEAAGQALSDALRESGIGAKTSLGYGIMK